MKEKYKMKNKNYHLAGYENGVIWFWSDDDICDDKKRYKFFKDYIYNYFLGHKFNVDKKGNLHIHGDKGDIIITKRKLKIIKNDLKSIITKNKK